jgi:hypothetical protein
MSNAEIAPSHAAPNNWAAITPTKILPAMFIALLKMTITTIGLLIPSLIFTKDTAPLFFCAARTRARLKETEKRAASIPEKNAEPATMRNIKNTRSFISIKSIAQINQYVSTFKRSHTAGYLLKYSKIR